MFPSPVGSSGSQGIPPLDQGPQWATPGKFHETCARLLASQCRGPREGHPAPTPRKPRRGTQEFSPLCLRALAFCALAKPRRPLWAWGLGAGAAGSGAAGPLRPASAGGRAPDGLKHPRGTGRAVQRSQPPARQGCRRRSAGAARRGGRGAEAVSRTSASAPAYLPATARRPGALGNLRPAPSRLRPGQPWPRLSRLAPPLARIRSQALGLRRHLRASPLSPRGLGRAGTAPAEPDSRSRWKPPKVAPEAPASSPSTASEARHARRSPGEHFNRLIRRSKLWCYAKGFA